MTDRVVIDQSSMGPVICAILAYTDTLVKTQLSYPGDTFLFPIQ